MAANPPEISLQPEKRLSAKRFPGGYEFKATERTGDVITCVLPCGIVRDPQWREFVAGSDAPVALGESGWTILRNGADVFFACQGKTWQHVPWARFMSFIRSIDPDVGTR